MDTEYHYYMTGIIAWAAGFPEQEAKIIATASEYTDENDDILKVENRNDGKIYENYISQTMNILKPKRSLMRIYPIFHFVPGEPDADTACRLDGKMHLLNTTPNSEIANTLIDEALKVTGETGLYRTGIATHAYADSWAHQNFVGWFDDFNEIGFNIKPDIGHADAEHHPDWPAHRWDDSRLVNSRVYNTSRFLDASEALYNKYVEALALKNINPIVTWQSLQQKLLDAMGEQFSGFDNYYKKERIDKYSALAPWLGQFDESEWFDAAIEKDLLAFCSGRHIWREDIKPEDTDWYRFQEAVKEHQRIAMRLIKPRFDRMGIDLKNW